MPGGDREGLTAPAGAQPLTARQADAFRIIRRDFDFRGRPVSAAFVAETLGVSHERARNLFRRLNELGWLRAAGTPAIPV